MHSTIGALALMVAAAATLAGEQCRAIDGDTLRCGRERVRLHRIYAAELGERGGIEARARLQQRIDSGDVWIERRGRDQYGRTIGVVYVNGVKVHQSDIGPRAGRGIRTRQR